MVGSSEMTREEYEQKLKELNVVEEESDFSAFSRGRTQIQFRHPLGIIRGPGYSQGAIKDLKKFHGIDAETATLDIIVEELEKHIALRALELIRSNGPDRFFEHFSFEYLEFLTDRYPEIAKIVANPEWKPR